jgi:hypothetical protein
MFFFELGDLFAERKLRYMQSVRSTREVQLFGQNHDCVQVSYFNVREHCSKLIVCSMTPSVSSSVLRVKRRVVMLYNPAPRAGVRRRGNLPSES